MRYISAFFAALLMVSSLAEAAVAGPVLTIVFSGNSWGYLKPCPT